MRTINNQFSKTSVIPRVTIWDDNDDKIVFGKPSIDDKADYGRVYEVSISQDIDSASPSADMSFRNHEDIGPSLDPLHSTSDFNDGTISSNLMNHQHDVKIEITKDGGNNWYTVFEGFVGNVSARKQVDKNDIIDFSPYGKDKPLKDVIILEGAPNQPLEYNNIDAFDCVDQILDDIDNYEGYNYDFSNLTFNRTISDNPKKTIYKPYKVKNTTVWEALDEVFSQTGYKLFFWHNGSGSYDLAVIDPLRGEISEVDHSFAGDFESRHIDLNDKDVRSQVVVFYNDREENGARERVKVEDDETRQNYGASDYGGNRIHRTMVLKEDEDSLIDTETEAESYANNALNDLKTPSPDTELSFPYAIPGIQLYDKIEAGGTEDYTVQLGVDSIEYSFSVDREIGTTTIRGTADRVVGRKSYWLNKGQLPDDIDSFKGDRKAPPKPSKPRLEKTSKTDQTGTTHVKVVCYGEHSDAFDVVGYQYRYRVCNTETGNCDEWKYPDQVVNPQKTITGLEANDKLKLEVEYSAIDWENKEWSGLPGDSPYSDTAEISLAADKTPPDPPSNLTAEPGPARVELSWDNPTQDKDGSDLTDLDHINIYYDNTETPEKDTDSTTKRETSGDDWTLETEDITEWYFRISAVDSSGNESQLTDTISETPKSGGITDGEAPATVDSDNFFLSTSYQETDSGGSSKIRAKWDVVTTNVEDETTSDIKGYEIQVQDDKAGDGVQSDDWEFGANVSQPDPDEESTVSAVISGLKVNVDYYVRIRTYDYEEKTSSWTNVCQVDDSASDPCEIETSADVIPPDDPSGLSTTSQETGIKLTWDDVDASDLRNYWVYVNDSSMSSLSDADYKFNAGDSSDFQFFGSPNKTYYLQVTAEDYSGNESDPSSEVSETSGSIIEDGVEWTVFDLDNDTLDEIKDGDEYGRIQESSLTDEGLLILDAVSDPDSGTYGLVEATYITGGRIELAETEMPNGEKTGVQLDSDGYIYVENQDGATAISGGAIQTEVITATEIEGNTITASEIDLSSDLQLASGGQIRAGNSTSFKDGGFWLGDDSGTWKLSVGDSGTSNYLSWNGSALDIRGSLSADDITSGTLDAATVDADTITTGTLDANDVSVVNLDADNITSGTIDSDHIVAGSSVEIGENIFSSSPYDGIFIDDGGRLQIDDTSGRTVFDSSGNFTSLPKASAVSGYSDSGTVNENTWTTVESDISGTILGGRLWVAFSTADVDTMDTYKLRISDDSGSHTVTHASHRDDVGRASQVDTNAWTHGGILFIIPVWQVDGYGEIELYHEEGNYRNWFYHLWYS